MWFYPIFSEKDHFIYPVRIKDASWMLHCACHIFSTLLYRHVLQPVPHIHICDVGGSYGCNLFGKELVIIIT